MPIKAVIMNDTGGGTHFGCDRVMRVIESNLARRGVVVTAKSRVRNKWWEDKVFLKAAEAADIIVINGEGTCHHARPHGEHLLRIVEHPVGADKPVVLINAMYQENPKEWGRYLAKFALIAARDSWSAAAMKEAGAREVIVLPDLSMSEGFHAEADRVVRTTLTVGESVLPEVSEQLIALADSRSDAVLLPLVTVLKGLKLKYPWPLRQLRKLYVHAHKGLFILKHRGVQFSKDEAEFSSRLVRSYLHVSGRFHAICIAITTKTPFLAITSNSWKIQALLEDLGIDKSRIVDVASLPELLAKPKAFAFSADELRNFEAAIQRGVIGAQAMFDDIARLAEEKSSRRLAG